MLNGDDAMSPAEFAKMMGAYPQPANNPLPAYGGYMDNSAANFAWVNNNDYFGAEGEKKNCGCGKDPCITYGAETKMQDGVYKTTCDCGTVMTWDEVFVAKDKDGNRIKHEPIQVERLDFPSPQFDHFEEELVIKCPTCGEYHSCEIEAPVYHDRLEVNFGAETFEATGKRNRIQIVEKNGKRLVKGKLHYLEEGGQYDKAPTTIKFELPLDEFIRRLQGSSMVNYTGYLTKEYDAETFDAQMDGEKLRVGGYDFADGSLMVGVGTEDIGSQDPDFMSMIIDKDGKLKYFTMPMGENDYQRLYKPKPAHYGKMKTQNETNESAGGDFIRIDGDRNAMFEAPYAGAGSLFGIGQNTGLEGFTTSELTTSSAIHGDFDEASLNYSGHQNLEVRAEMEELTDGVASITNRFGDGVGIIQVDDEDLEDVSVELTDGSGDVVYEGILSDEDVPEMEEDDFYYSENKKTGWVALASLAIGTLTYLNRDVLTSSIKKVFNNETQEMLENTPELIESPNIGNLDPAQYEELVVESTGYAVDVIPVGLDGSFMGSRFAALPTERYVEYSDPGIGAHTDVAMNRDEIYLEPEMAMVQASEGVKESEAPGQSPYNSITGEENTDFSYRVLKETSPRSLDPAVVPFIPQDMDGYTGNANTPPSVYNKMFNLGVLGQTPAFVPGSSDMGANHFGSRNATPNKLGIGGSVGGPLSDQVNANYTDGTTSMSLAQWSIENTVSQTSDTEAVVIDRSSGLMKRVRRV